MGEDGSKGVAFVRRRLWDVAVMFASSAIQTPKTGMPLRAGLWTAQIVAALVFCFAGYTKLMTPIPQLSDMMPWTGSVSEAFVRVIGLIDLAGGMGLLLPSLTRILPGLTIVAALCCGILQVLAIGFHGSRGEFAVLPLNAVLLALSIFIFWGRAKKVPVGPRGRSNP